MFDPKLDFGPRFRFFGHNFDYEPKLWFLVNISIFDRQFQFLSKIMICGQKTFYPRLTFCANHQVILNVN